MRKIIFILFACFACAQSASAQDYYESGSDIYGLGETSYVSRWNKQVSFSIGSQVELGFIRRRNFGQYFAWDVVGISYAYDYSGERFDDTEDSYYKHGTDVNHELKFRTGVRGFTPSWGKIKGFASVGWAVEGLFYKEYYRGKSSRTVTPAMGIDVQVGFYIGKKFNIGYQLDVHRLGYDETDHTDHLIRLAVDF